MRETETTASARRALRVCVLVPKLRMGGAEAQVLSQLEHLDPSRFTAALVCLNAGDGAMEERARRSVESIDIIGFRWRRFPISFAKLAACLRRGRFDVVHCHLPLADALGRIAGWLSGVPVRVTTEHGKFLGKRRCRLVLERMLVPITDARICVSRDILEIRRMREGTPAAKLLYIPNGVDTVRFRTPSRGRAAVMAELGWDAARPLVLAVGRLEPEKNYELLIRAIGRVRSNRPDVACLLVGDGSRRDGLARLVTSLGLGEAVKLAGARGDIPDLLAAADVFVISSLKEGLPVSLLEAMAAGKAIVATAVGGVPEALRDGENGALVESGDEEGMARAVAALLGDDALRVRFGRAAAADAESTYAIEKVVGKIEALYIDLVDRKSKGRSTA